MLNYNVLSAYCNIYIKSVRKFDDSIVYMK